MVKVLRHLFFVFFIPISIYLIFVNWRLAYQPEWQSNSGYVVNNDLEKQLHYLKSKLHSGAAESMQNIYPEGFIFSQALYGLSWCELLRQTSPTSLLFQEGIQEIDWVIEQLDSPDTRVIFSEHTKIPYGAFYNGWLNYLIGQKLLLPQVTSKDTVLLNRFKHNCDMLYKAYYTNNTPYLDSYYNQVWPADNVVCIASIALYKHILQDSKYQLFINHWIEQAKNSTDSITQLIPHSTTITGKMLESPRGSSQSLINCFLTDIDSSFAQDQFQKYKKHFLDSRLGLPGVREYPKGQFGLGDIDSGPVIWGIGGAASIVGIRAFGKQQDWKVSKGLRNSVEGFGIPVTTSQEKKYLFGRLIIADLFIAWSHAIYPNPDVETAINSWQLYFLLYSILFWLSGILLFIFPRRKKKIKA